MYKIYSKPGCSNCTSAKNLLTSKSIPFVEMDITDEATKERLLTEVPHARTVPQIFYNETYIGGYNELHERNRNNDTSNLLFG
jgi:glutaredoxin 3